MRSFVAGAAAALMGGVASAQNFRVVANVVEIPGEVYYQQRVWYGDGNLYVGARVPAGVDNALNFTVPDWSATVPNIVVAPLPPATVEDLPEGTVIAINNATGATDPVILTNDPSTLGPDYIYRWLRWGTIMVPQADAGSSPTDTFFFLQETEESGTSIITWRTPGTGSGGLQDFRLLAIL